MPSYSYSFTKNATANAQLQLQIYKKCGSKYQNDTRISQPAKRHGKRSIANAAAIDNAPLDAQGFVLLLRQQQATLKLIPATMGTPFSNNMIDRRDC